MLLMFLVGRIIFGGYFIMSGYSHFKNLEANTGYAKSKGVPMAKQSVIITGIMMFLGGLGIVFGIFVDLALLLLILFMLGTLVKMHRYWEVTEPMARMGERINFYKNLALLGALLMMWSMPLPWIVAPFY